MYKSLFFPLLFLLSFSLSQRNAIQNVPALFMPGSLIYKSFGANVLCSYESYLSGLCNSETKIQVDNNVLSNRYKETYLAFFFFFLVSFLRALG